MNSKTSFISIVKMGMRSLTTTKKYKHCELELHCIGLRALFLEIDNYN